MSKPNITPKEALELTFYSGDLNKTLTIRAYFKKLLSTLFEEGESFEGKRPFGNSGWDFDLAPPLIKAKAVEGTITPWGRGKGEVDVSLEDEEAFFKFVYAMIEEL